LLTDELEFHWYGMFEADPAEVPFLRHTKPLTGRHYARGVTAAAVSAAAGVCVVC
jgi:hypothetical protein